MSQTIQAFGQLLSRAPQGVQECFEGDRYELDRDYLERYLSSASRSQAVLAKFFAAVRVGRNNWNFDLLDVDVLDREFREIIMKWVAKPIWP